METKLDITAETATITAMASHTQRGLKVRVFQGSKFFMVAMRLRGL